MQKMNLNEFDSDFVNKILDCFYVNDFTGAESDFYKALDLFKKLKMKFLNGYFHLHKWRTNDPKLRKIILENICKFLKPEKILRILWEEVDDILVFEFSKICKTYKTLDITKVFRVFQEYKKQKLSCDELLPNHFTNEFEKIMLSLQDMEKVSIDRNVFHKQIAN